MAAVAAEHDEVDPLGAGGVHDGLARVAFPDEELAGDPHLLASSHEGLGGLLPLVADLVDAGGEPTPGEAQRARIDDADREQTGVQPGGEAQGFILSRSRRR